MVDSIVSWSLPTSRLGHSPGDRAWIWDKLIVFAAHDTRGYCGSSRATRIDKVGEQAVRAGSEKGTLCHSSRPFLCSLSGHNAARNKTVFFLSPLNSPTACQNGDAQGGVYRLTTTRLLTDRSGVSL